MIGLLPAALPAVAVPQPVAQRIGPAPAMEMWQVDQVRLPLRTPAATLAALEPDHSLTAVIARLKAMGVPFTRARVALLPDRMPPQLRGQLDGLPAGEPFILPERDYISVNVIVGRILPPDTVRYMPPRRSTPSHEA